MDPASIIGVASAAITFVECGYKFLSTLYTLYQDRDAIAGYEELMAVNGEMGRLSLHILNTPSLSDSRGSGIAEVSDLAQLCCTLSSNLSKKITKSKPQGPGAMQMLRATVRAISSKEEIDRLQRALDNCRAQLHFHHAISHSVETKQSLERVELASTFFINSVEKSRENANRANILSSLAFDVMNARYNSISAAETSTYEWIFDDKYTGAISSTVDYDEDDEDDYDHDHDHDYAEDSSSSVAPALPFKDWLVSGNGIFHLSGKLGAGKSTLMKLLSYSSKTKSELRKWAGHDKLLLGKFFFWKPGSALQNSLLGMVRSILHQTLCNCPDLVPVAFPQLWNPAQYDFLGNPLPLQMDHEAIFDAFDALFQDSALYRTHKACFFIDGLDEFVEERRSYSDLVDWLQSWVNRSGGSLKLCVSSRELPPFLDYLDAKQRIRLQDLSGNDITTAIRQTLGRNRRFLLFQQANKQECSQFMRQIAQKSDGVFLWVTLTLKMIIDSLDGREPLKSIMAQVDSLPEELETLFGRVLESIPKVQRTSAYSYFAYALGLATIQAENWLEFWPFLDDYIESPNFAKGLPLEWIKPEKRPRRIGIAADRIQSRTRGLLEIAPGDMDDRIGSLVVFAHRSIPEFLQDALETEKIRRQIRDFDFIRAHINVLLAYAKSTQLSDIDFRHSLILREYQIVPLISFIRGMKETTASKYFYELNLLDEATTRQHSSRRSVSRSLVSSPTPDSPWVSFPSWRSPTPACVACSMGFNDYVVWKAATYPKTLQTSVGIGLFEAILDTVRLHRANASRRESVRGLKSLLREMMKLDIDLSQLPNRGGAVTDRLSYWAFILQLMCLDRESGRHWTHLETMLENGAPNPSWRRSGEMVNLHLGDEVYSYHWDVVERDWDPKLLPASKLDRGDTITLKDWVDEYEPENGGKILMLLGGTTTDDETTTAKAEDEKTGYLDRRLQTFFAAAWNRLSQLLGSRALPWILVGLFSALLLREGVGSWAR